MTETKKIQPSVEELQALYKTASQHPQKQPGDVCIGALPSRVGELMIWSAEDSQEFCQIAGLQARKIGYLPWREVQDFLRQYTNKDTSKESKAIPSLVKLKADSSAHSHNSGALPEKVPAGTVVEFREIQPRAFFWEQIREVMPPGTLKPLAPARK